MIRAGFSLAPIHRAATVLLEPGLRLWRVLLPVVLLECQQYRHKLGPLPREPARSATRCPRMDLAPQQYLKTEPVSDFTFLGGPGVNGVEPHIRQPYTESWNLGIQRQLGDSRALEIRYVGNRSLRQWMVINQNEVNIFENGFLDQFKAAQQNLAINQANESHVVRQQRLCRATGAAGV